MLCYEATANLLHMTAECVLAMLFQLQRLCSFYTTLYNVMVKDVLSWECRISSCIRCL